MNLLNIDPGFNPAQVVYLQCIRNMRHLAREHGYALAVHGSLGRDIDILLVPWTTDAKPTAKLMTALRFSTEVDLAQPVYLQEFTKEADKKPHGRRCFLLTPQDLKTYFDIGVVPLIPSEDEPEYNI